MGGDEEVMAKVGQQVLMSPHRKKDILELAVAREESQAEVLRTGVEIFVPLLQHSHERPIRELREAFERMGVDHLEALEEMAAVKVRADGERRRLTIADLKTGEGEWRQRFPWGARPVATRG